MKIGFSIEKKIMTKSRLISFSWHFFNYKSELADAFHCFCYVSSAECQLNCSLEFHCSRLSFFVVVSFTLFGARLFHKRNICHLVVVVGSASRVSVTACKCVSNKTRLFRSGLTWNTTFEMNRLATLRSVRTTPYELSTQIE